jgi:hypothetical protein
MEIINCKNPTCSATIEIDPRPDTPGTRITSSIHNGNVKLTLASNSGFRQNFVRDGINIHLKFEGAREFSQRIMEVNRYSSEEIFTLTCENGHTYDYKIEVEDE